MRCLELCERNLFLVKVQENFIFILFNEKIIHCLRCYIMVIKCKSSGITFLLYHDCDLGQDTFTWVTLSYIRVKLGNHDRIYALWMIVNIVINELILYTHCWIIALGQHEDLVNVSLMRWCVKWCLSFLEDLRQWNMRLSCQFRDPCIWAHSTLGS